MRKPLLIAILLWSIFNLGKAQPCNIPTFLNFTYSINEVSPGVTVEVTWDFDCPDADILISLLRHDPAPFAVVQQYTNLSNDGSFMFNIGEDMIAGTYCFYIQDMGVNIWSYGPNFDLTLPLPIELVSFSGEVKDEKVKLNWQTEREYNNLGFEIEKSSDGVEWSLLDFVEGKGTVEERSNYEYIDESTIADLNYYRLKQFDFNDKFEYSEVIVIESKTTNHNFLVYPNPSYRNFNLHFDNPNHKETKVSVMDNFGTTIWESKSSSESDWRKEIEIQESGMYMVIVQIGAALFHERVMVLN